MKFSKYFLVAALALSVQSPCLADKTDPDFLPPDVTLSTSGAAIPSSAASSAAVPGVVAPAAAAPSASNPGGAGGAASASVPGVVAPGAEQQSKVPPGLPLSMMGASGGAQPPPPPSAGGLYSRANPASAPVGATSSGLYQGSGLPVDPNKADPIAVIETAKGEIRIQLFRKYAPKTVDNFMELVQKGFYNGLTFHRVEPGFCIQGGCPKGDGTGLYIDKDTHQMRFLPLEVSPNLRHNGPGVVAMARFGQSPNSGSCQFYITLAAKPHLDNMYTIFGGVLSGMDVVNRIQKGDVINCISLVQQ